MQQKLRIEISAAKIRETLDMESAILQASDERYDGMFRFPINLPMERQKAMPPQPEIEDKADDR